MRTIETKIFTFDELSEEAKKRAIKDFQASNMAEEICKWSYDEWKNTVNVFEAMVGIEVNLISDYYGNKIRYKVKIPECCWLDSAHIDETGTTGKLLYRIVNKVLFTMYYRQTFYVGEIGHMKRRVSRILPSSECTFECYNLTGTCYDIDFIKPFIEYYRHPDKKMTYEDLIVKCLDSAMDTIKEELDTICYDDKYAVDAMKDHDYEFYEDGILY